jgi:hypothetical protein
MPDKTEEKTPKDVLAETEAADEPKVDRRDAEPEEEDLRPIADPEVAAQMAKAREMGITGDPDAEPGYFVDENHRPNMLDVGTVITTEYHGVSSYDVASYSGAIANAGADPFEGVEVPESPPAPEPMGATDYDPTLKAGVPSEEAMAAHQQSMVEQAELTQAQAEADAAAQEAVDERLAAEEEGAAPEGRQGDPKVAEAKAKADATVESAEETAAAIDEVQTSKTPTKAQGAKAAPSPAGTKDTALEADPKK